MIDYYLKFSSQEEAYNAFKDAGYTVIDDTGKEIIISSTHEYCIDEVGLIYSPGQYEVDSTGNVVVIQEPVHLEGWHFNVRMISGEISEVLKPFAIETPKTPYRIFA